MTTLDHPWSTDPGALDPELARLLGHALLEQAAARDRGARAPLALDRGKAAHVRRLVTVAQSRTLAALLGVGLGLVAACGPRSEQMRERDACYDRAETVAQARLEAVCPGVPIAECPGSGTVLARLQVDQEACP